MRATPLSDKFNQSRWDEAPVGGRGVAQSVMQLAALLTVRLALLLKAHSPIRQSFCNVL